jgi:peptidoglycan/xylan/chitin deacetylase (PgdA/CDA1 family)
MMRRVILLFFLTINLFSIEIKNYKPIYGCILENNQINIAIRSFFYNNHKCYLALEPNSLQTYFTKASKLYKCPDLNSTKFKKLLNLSISNTKHPLQNDGITSAKNGLYLTNDFCPSSKKGFEKRLYQALIDNFKNPVPITIFITKKWINTHKAQFNKLKQWQEERKLNITWGNHTANHIYYPNTPLNKNFVLSKNEHLVKDILDLEECLIKNGVTPSIFFRFPGLVSNKKAIKIVANLSLITIGSNSWLAKKEPIKNGSIILVHGNKNEPLGVDIFLKLLKDGFIKKLDDIKELDF